MGENKFKDESNLIEYKVALPEENIKWLKSIVSFSNTAGGKLIIGVEDSTLKVVGISEERSKIEQRIVESIHGNIEPNPIIDVSFENYEDKYIVIVHVAKGSETPYFIKKEGIEEGVYVRFGSTDQKATNSQKLELRFKRSKETFTSEIYNKNNKLIKIDELELSEFLKVVNSQIKSDKEINLNKLLEWNLIKYEFDTLYATNGLMLLKESAFSQSYIKLGVFSGITKSKLMKDYEIKGSIISQYHEAMKILLSELDDGYSFSMLREKKYKVPEIVLREVLSNAIIHRSYIEEQTIRISIFDNRIEFYSPGTLYDGLQIEEAINGRSKLRNPNISEVFYHIGIIDKWGSGIQRANEKLMNENLSPLIFEVNNVNGVNVIIKFENTFNINVKSEINVDNYLDFKSTFTRKELENDLNITQDQARYIIEKWIDKGRIVRTGGSSKTKYNVNIKI